MPAHFVPHKSGLHRSAAHALFRALLGACRAVPLDAEIRTDLQNVVRNTFRKRRSGQNREQLGIWFQGGYDALDLLDAASGGDESKISTIRHYAGRIPAHLKIDIQRAHPISTSASALNAEKRRDMKSLVPRAPKDSIFERPRPLNSLSGTRHIPQLAHAGIFYFLRVKKPQPYVLTGVLNSLLDRRERRQGYIAKIEEFVRLAKFEDAWDADMANQLRVAHNQDSEGDASTWAAELEFAAHELRLKLYQESIWSRNRAERLLKIIEEEKRLAEMEMARSGDRFVVMSSQQPADM